MKKAFILLVMMAMALVFSVQAQAGLETIGTATYLGTDYNLIYDNDDNLTWLDYTNGSVNWDNQNSWALGLNTVGVLTYKLNAGLSMDWGSSVWRLPTITDIGNDGCNWSYGETDCGYNVDTGTGELAHLFHDELANQSKYDEFGVLRDSGTWGLQNTGDFQNLQNLQTIRYWSGTEYAPNANYAWIFHIYNGNQGYDYKDNINRGIAVRSGLAVVPEPMSMVLFGVGGVVLAGRRMLSRRRDR